MANGDIGRRKGASNNGYSHDSEKDEISRVPNGNGNASHLTSNETASTKKTVVIIGSGDLGMALTMCFVRSGYRVVVASRNPNKNRKRITDIGGEIDFFERAVQQSSIIIVAIPYEAFDTLSASELRRKIVVDVSNRPFDYDPKKKPLAIRLQKQLPESSVVKAFNTLSAYCLQKGLTQGSSEVPICSNDEEAKSEIINIARTVGFTPVDYGSLSNARAIEDIPLEFFSEWRVAMVLGICVWVFAFLYMLFKRQLCPNFEHLSNDEPWDWSVFESLPLSTFHHTDGITSITLLAACYFPGVLAAYLQLKRGTKYSRFPKWLDMWLKARKTMGVLALLLALTHF
ncbi:histone H3.1 [Armadillidium nasatum]|uniref:Histone H3.1 n=1 Tax=Armadillidium nasatum TaxID=96803 RepID=A0A5N5SQ85_9CRUS|nr:histone H3.1 [Armadillidium nasatum]